MTYHTTTPFGRRPVTAGLIENAARLQEQPVLDRIDKWQLFRNLCTARHSFGVSSQDLTVLNALLSFLPERSLDADAQLIVFPSNRSLSDRAHGMAESTLRRHLAALVTAGLIHRNDSPNGKRYAVRGAGGQMDRCFGFDLRLLLVRATEIAEAATREEARQRQLKALKEQASLLKRDAIKLLEYALETGPDTALEALQARVMTLCKGLRRKMDIDTASELVAALTEISGDIAAYFETETELIDANDRENERHYQNSNTHPSDLEPAEEGSGAPVAADAQNDDAPPLPLALVLKACPELAHYSDGDCRHWPDLVRVADRLRAMMGISPSAWEDARRTMGAATAAITVACILQRFEAISSPGGYLRSLTAKASSTGFSPGPMVMALLNSGPSRAGVGS